MLLTGAIAQAQCVLQVKGQIIDADTRKFLEKATVNLVGTKTIIATDDQGNFLIKGLCPGDYTLRISHAGCQTIDYHFHLKEDFFKTIELPHAENVLKEVVVVGTTSIRNEGITGELKGKELAATRGLTLGESLQKITGVTVLQTGNNIYKPVIQGMHSSRVLILNNGIRQEGQQWGSEHAPEIDPYVANRLTVIKGASSVRYGGDAIGGVILVEPRLLQYKKELQGELNLATFSNNRQGVASAMIEGGFDRKENTAWRLQGTVKRGGNARTPDYWLKNSGVEEMNMSATTGWRKANKGVELFYSLFNTRVGIFSGSHIGNLTDLENVIKAQEPPLNIKNEGFTYQIERPYQFVQHHLLKFRAFAEQEGKSRISLTLSSQYNQRKEYDLTRSATELPQLELDLSTQIADLIFEHYADTKIKGSMGLNAMYQSNFINYRYFVPNYQSLDYGLWIAEKLKQGKWQFELGLRYDNRRRYDIRDNDKSPFDLTMGNPLLPGDPYGTRNFSGMSGTTVAAYTFNDHLRMSFTASTAWRSPQVNELFSNGLHHGAARIEKGDPGLLPERAFSAMTNLVYNKDRWDLEWGVFSKSIDNFIYLKPTYPALLTIRGAFPSFAFAQTNAHLAGSDLSVSYNANAHLKAHGKASILRAYDRTARTWLIQMPADRYEAEIEYDFIDGKKWKQSYVKLGWQHVTKQTRVPATGNIEVKDINGNITMQSDYIPPPAAYTLVNVEAGSGLMIHNRKVDLVLAVSNLFNVSYRDYMNAFRYFSLDRGRNISLKLKLPLF